MCLLQAADAYAAATTRLDSAAAALSNMAAGFHLEDVTSRRSSAAPPSPLVLAGQQTSYSDPGCVVNIICVSAGFACTAMSGIVACFTRRGYNKNSFSPYCTDRVFSTTQADCRTAAAESLLCSTAGCHQSCASPSPHACCCAAGVPQHQVAELTKSYPALTSTTGSSPSTSPPLTAVETLVRDLSTLLSQSQSRAAGHQSTTQRLQMVAHDLPKVLSGPLLELLAVSNTAGMTDAAGVKQQQHRLQAFISVLESELPKLAGDHSSSATTSSSGWSSAGGNIPAAGDGVLELLGEEDSKELLQHVAAVAEQGGAQEQGLYEQLSDIHHDGDVQRYLQVSCGVHTGRNTGHSRHHRHINLAQSVEHHVVASS